MAHKKSLEAMDRTLQELRGNSEVMGGALPILSGDFRQTLIPESTLADEINACLKKIISLATHTNTATNKKYKSGSIKKRNYSTFFSTTFTNRRRHISISYSPDDRPH
ncbi:unnamed protein product [Ceutorhynchus assimilis]|uniref:Uncharacterized protein n=1 Tax=Ceutorhynchus assimilis TaxID=467358 RepID=A0A9N9MZ14_9CUCU|nr:unnamed protein product [Ceutorhynchus assimilis]